MPGSQNETDANGWNPPRTVNSRADSLDHGGPPIPSNCKEITFLCTTWKLLSGIKVAKMIRHMAKSLIGAQESRVCKVRQTNLCTTWIDYKKAYDSGYTVPQISRRCLQLFCIGLNPFSQIITKDRYEYRFQSGATISHLLYMDDIKLYTRKERHQLIDPRHQALQQRH